MSDLAFKVIFISVPIVIMGLALFAWVILFLKEKKRIDSMLNDCELKPCTKEACDCMEEVGQDKDRMSKLSDIQTNNVFNTSRGKKASAPVLDMQETSNPTVKIRKSDLEHSNKDISRSSSPSTITAYGLGKPTGKAGRLQREQSKKVR